jgi:hypothetical protein
LRWRRRRRGREVILIRWLSFGRKNSWAGRRRAETTVSHKQLRINKLII